MTRTFFLPVTKTAAPLALAILRAATKAPKAKNSIAFHVALAPDALPSDRASIQAVCNAFPHVLPERSDNTVDLSKPQEIAHAMEACDGVVLASRAAAVGASGSDPLLLETELNLLSAATDVGLQHVVKVSCAPALLGEHAKLASGRAHWQIEQQLRSSSSSTIAIIRPTTSMDTLLHGRMYDMVCGRTLSVSVKHGRIAFIHPQDVADAIVKIASGKVNGSDSDANMQEFDLTGPEAFTFADVAALLSKHLQPAVRYSHFPLWAVQPSLWIKGVRPDDITSDIALSEALERGAEANVTSVLQELLGQAPRTLDAFVSEHQKEWPLRSHQ